MNRSGLLIAALGTTLIGLAVLRAWLGEEHPGAGARETLTVGYLPVT